MHTMRHEQQCCVHQKHALCTIHVAYRSSFEKSELHRRRPEPCDEKTLRAQSSFKAVQIVHNGTFRCRHCDSGMHEGLRQRNPSDVTEALGLCARDRHSADRHGDDLFGIDDAIEEETILAMRHVAVRVG